MDDVTMAFIVSMFVTITGFSMIALIAVVASIIMDKVFP